ncbi:MAG: hypothetical protein JO316_23950 [Abitibacteriaceae bacterium]|nr:hypothetical protein [Abditibacteriaceae bacterium]MBV9868419.1 hypothetical protein [Abditibacteriaceae bacterium]
MITRTSQQRLYLLGRSVITPVVLAIGLLTLVACGSQAATAPRSIYEDALSTGWADWSWDSTINLAANSPVKSGTHSISVTYKAGWGGLYLHHTSVPLDGYTHLQFWIHGGGSGGQNLYVYAEDLSGRKPVQVPLSRYLPGGVAANAWKAVSIPLADLDLSDQPLTGLVWQNGTASSQGTFYVDSIRLINDGVTPTPTPQPTATPQPTPAGAPEGVIPAALGSNMMLGLSSLPDDYNWLVQSHIPWSARYTYLTGGVNTPNNWTYWNSPTGQYATYYLNNSGQAHCLPVFTYYQILASNPRPYDETLPAYVAKFNDANCMKAYYNDFKLLMQKCAAFGKPVLVHVEPDTWGYMMMTKSSPALYTVKVASSGHADATELPNNAVGFAQMLVRLRDRYAPKVLLALHASTWAEGTDITLNTDPSYNVKANAERTGAWLSALGAGWNLVFVDVADRDAAYKQIVRGQNTWWDERDLRLPNFARVASWIGYLNRKVQRRIIVWQIPLGNTKMLSCDNTPGHYQDNRVQYFLDAAYGQRHLAAWAQAGVIGLLFGRGDTNTTTNTDAERDSITNPAAINGNTRRATVADDDGGYFRERAAAYLQTPFHLPGAP